MKLSIKTFEELTKQELYDLLQLRSEVFVVEQDCVYQDIDGKDDRALHVMMFVNDSLAAYTRCFPPGVYFEEAAIGRVVVSNDARGHGYGKVIMETSLVAIREKYGVDKVRVSAQTYLKRFYEELGFKQEGEGYLEDGIPHISMILSSSSS